MVLKDIFVDDIVVDGMALDCIESFSCLACLSLKCHDIPFGVEVWCFYGNITNLGYFSWIDLGYGYIIESYEVGD